jgi:hypothetical protein
VKDLKTVISAPAKDEAERMVKVAYYLDKKFLRPTDIVDLGIDLYRLKEFGEVRMSKSPAKLRPHTAGLWGRMTESMKAMFLWSYFCDKADELRNILGQLMPLVKSSCREEHVRIEQMLGAMALKLPKELQEKIREGFGREWR